MPSTLLIGAGIAGLTAARELTRQGHHVTVLDKGRGVGGRMATRRIDQSRLDHGAQYFTAHSPDFQTFTTELIESNVVGIWPVSAPDGTTPHYIGREGMSAIAKHMAESLDIQTGERVVRIEQISVLTGQGWRVTSETDRTFEADNLLITIPAPQALTLLHDSAIDMGAVDFTALEAIQYAPCITVMAVLKRPSQLPQPGSLRPDHGPVAWLADNFQKGISPNQPSVTIQANSAFSQAHFDNDLMGVGHALLGQLAEYIPPADILTYQVHRWRYSMAEVRHPEPYLRAQTPAPLLFGGDGFGTGNVEGAFLSGLAMARAVSAGQ